MKVRIINKSNNEIPMYQSSGAAGFDLRSNLEEDLIIKPGKIVLVPTGIYIAVPEGYELQIRARSGLALKNGIGLVNGIGTIDSDYRGEIKVILINFGENDFVIKNGDRIAQAVLNKYERVDFEIVDELDETKRGTKGFGSSGV